MNSFVRSISLLLNWAVARNAPERMCCPSCSGEPSAVIDRRFLFLTLAKCKKCNLLYRQPTDDPHSLERYYEEEYHEQKITDIPGHDELTRLVEDKFSKSFNCSNSISLIRHLTGSGTFKVLDFGCSWGYASWQIRRSGFDVDGFEIGRTRAEFARKWLEIPIYSKLEDICGPYDVIYSSHVFEHVPALSSLVERLSESLSPGGFFISLTPNGDPAAQKQNFRLWHKLWGRRHPIYLTCEYWYNQFPNWKKIAFSRATFSGEFHFPLSTIPSKHFVDTKQLSLSGEELVFIAQKPK